MYRFDKCVILKVLERSFHRYFVCSAFKKNVARPKALILRHVHVQVGVHQCFFSWSCTFSCSAHMCTCTCTDVHVYVHVLMWCTCTEYMYLYMYWCTRTCTCTDVHVPVHVLMYAYLYMYWCTRTCTVYMYWCPCTCAEHENLHDQEKKQGTWTWTWKSIALKCNATIKVTDLVSKNWWFR
jgi:hypothetical protein